MPGRIQSIERAAAILRLLSGRARRMGVVELAGQLELPKATVHGILRTLRDVGFVEQDPESGKYQLGAALLHMGSSYLDGNELRTRALNWSDSLASRSRESVRIGTLHEGRVLVVHHVFRPDDSLQALEVGTLLPAHATAIGKALLAESPYVAGGAGRRRASTRFTAGDDHRSRRAARRSCARSASAAGRRTSRSSSTARCPTPRAIKDRRGLAVGAIGISGPVERLRRRRRAAHRAGLLRARGRPRGLARPGRNPVVRRLGGERRRAR